MGKAFLNIVSSKSKSTDASTSSTHHENIDKTEHNIIILFGNHEHTERRSNFMVHIHVTVKTITKSELKHSCHQSPYFALIADETTDKVTTTHVCVRFTEAVGDEVVV